MPTRRLATTLRHLLAQKLYTAINIGGLAIALAAAVMVGLFVRHELSYDRYHANASLVYRVSQFLSPPNTGTIRGVGAPPIYAPLLRADFPEIEATARLRACSRTTVVEAGDRRYPEPKCMAADAELFRLFDFEWLEGNASTALREPYSAVLTATAARKYFGGAPALGQTLVIDGGAPVAVTGVIRDLPGNTHLDFTMLLSMQYLVAVHGNALLDSDNDGSFFLYALIRAGASADGIRDGARAFIARHRGEQLSAIAPLEIVPVTAIHLEPPFRGDMRPPGDPDTVYASAAVAVLIVLLACINFVNLSTASARRRAKEVDVRKAIGAGRGQLVAQFLGESLMLCGVALGLALVITELTLPVFGAFMQRDLSFEYAANPGMLVALLCVTTLVALAAGSFPAFYLAAFEPAKVLKGDATRGRSAVVIRRALVGAQLAISIALLIATLVIYDQIRFMRDVDPGYERDQVVVVADESFQRLAQRWDVLKREWLAGPGIVGVTASRDAPGSRPSGGDLLRGEGADPSSPAVDMTFESIDFDFFGLYKIAVVAGREFSAAIGSDFADSRSSGGFATAAVAVVNESAARALGWDPQDAVGKRAERVPISGQPGAMAEPRPPVTIVGVVADVHYEPLRERIVPTMYTLPPRSLAVASIKIDARDAERALAHIDEVWRRVVPEQAIARRFLDDDFASFYRAEERQGRLLAYCSDLALFIACLGLFGLAALTTEQRTKEIGIRRVFGGTIADIVRVFVGELGWLALLANAVAWPVAYLAMRQWLDGFAYRIEPQPLLFVAAGAGVVAVAWCTVAGVAARAARAKPIHALRQD
jgi:putative ABC transport system permease protein